MITLMVVLSLYMFVIHHITIPFCHYTNWFHCTLELGMQETQKGPLQFIDHAFAQVFLHLPLQRNFHLSLRGSNMAEKDTRSKVYAGIVSKNHFKKDGIENKTTMKNFPLSSCL